MPRLEIQYTPPLLAELNRRTPLRGAAPRLNSLLIKARARFLAGRLLEYSADACLYSAIGYSALTLLLWVTGRVTPQVTQHLVTLAIIAIPLYSLIRLLWTRFGLLDTARLIDHYLNLKEEFSAAIEGIASPNPFSNMLTQQANETAGGLTAVKAIPIALPRRAVLSLGALMIAGAATFLPYGTSIFSGSSEEETTRMAQQGYQLLEEAQRINSQAQAIGDQKLQKLGDEMAKTARKMTERFSSERQIQRDLKKLAQDLAALNSAEMGRAEELAEAGRELEEAYGQKTMDQSPGGRTNDRIKAAMRQADDALNEGNSADQSSNGTGESPGDIPSDSKILDEMQKLQDETANAQSRQDALSRAQESLNQTMDTLGVERPKEQENQEQEDKANGSAAQNSQGFTEEGNSRSDNTGEDQAQAVVNQESQGGGTGTEGGHIDGEGQKKPRRESQGPDQRLTGQKGKGSVTSTSVLGSGEAKNVGSDSNGPVQGFSSTGGTKETAVEMDRVPAAYRQIVQQYFGRK